MKFKTAEEVRDYLWDKLGLSGRCFNIHLMDIGDGAVHVHDGIIEDAYDLCEDDGFYDVAQDIDEPEIHVSYVESWCIGTGEWERPDFSDIETIQAIIDGSPEAFDAFIGKYGDFLCDIQDFHVENPAWDPACETYREVNA